MQNGHILLLGDAQGWRWHPLDDLLPLQAALRAAGQRCALVSDYGALTPQRLCGCGVIVNYIDNWEAQGTPAAEAALLGWLKAGGRMVSLHNGIILPQAPALQHAHGAAFLRHDPARRLCFGPAPDAPAPFGALAGWACEDEPYEFTFFDDVPRQVFWQYRRDGAQTPWPAGWRTACEKGEIVYLCGGHTADAIAQSATLAAVLAAIGLPPR